MVDIGKKRRVEGTKGSGANDGYGTDYISRQKANKSIEEKIDYFEYNEFGGDVSVSGKLASYFTVFISLFSLSTFPLTVTHNFVILPAER